MCHQAVGLIQAELERRGIRTASVTMLPEVSAAVRPPRALSVPFPLGYPLGAPRDPELQRRILRALLAVTMRDDVPLLVDLEPMQQEPGTSRKSPSHASTTAAGS
jgi:hypothetical protein